MFYLKVFPIMILLKTQIKLSRLITTTYYVSMNCTMDLILIIWVYTSTSTSNKTHDSTLCNKLILNNLINN